MANRDYGKNCSTAVKKMADGGLLSSGNPIFQLVDRLTAGNIDKPGSEAYNRWGDGAKKALDAESAAFKDLPTNTGIESAPAAKSAPAKDSPAPAASTPVKDRKLDEVKPLPPREVKAAPKDAGKSFGTGLASGYAAMENSKAAHAALQKKKKPDASTSLVDQIPKDTSKESDLASRVAMIPGYAHGGLIGGSRNYGKK